MRTPHADTTSPGERLEELLCLEAVEGLPAHDAAELQALLDEQPDADRDAIALTAAALHLALDEAPRATMPDHLRHRVLAVSADDGPAPFEPAVRRALAPHAGLSITAPRRDTQADRPDVAPAAPEMRVGLAWLVAVAASLLAVLSWFPRAVTETPGELRATLLSATDHVRADWAGTGDPTFAHVAGDVVWSDTAQAGAMRLVGLPANDPAVAQYQLWIVDPDRDAHPVDGGVFDVVEDGEVIVPFHSRLPVDAPTTFAITLEQPGGVVVSAGPLLVAAATGG